MTICKVFRFYILILVGLWPAVMAAQGPLLNEIVSLNETGLQDSDGDHPDWIELYNPGDDPIELLGYNLTDDDDNEAHWSLPDLILPPGGHALIFASGKDLPNAEEPHTDFKVSSEGEWLYLYDPDGGLVDQVFIPPLAQDRSFGRSPDGGQTWSRLDIPTPGSSNDGSNHLEFSRASGFYSDSFSLNIFSLTDDSIFYTRDGSVPNPNSDLFEGSLSVNDPSGEPNLYVTIPTSAEGDLLSYKAWESPGEPVAKANVLRFATYRHGLLTTKIYTLTFFVGATVGRYSMPVMSLVTEPANLFDPDTGIYVPGQHFDPVDPEWTGNFFQRGEEWERDVHISYFPGEGPPAFSQDAGVRIHGGKTRQAAQKSLRLYARKDYGTQYFDYPLMPHRDVPRYKRFILRTTMGAWEGQTMIADEMAQRISSDLDLEYQDSRAIVVFVNGEYWGIHAIRDRIDDRYLEYTSSVDRDSIMFNDEHPTDYDELLDYASFNDLSLPENYNVLSQMMDVDNYIDYQIAEQFFRNYDWPANNLKAWKKISSDGRWRWIFFDLDAAFGDPEYDMLKHTTLNDPTVTYPNPPGSTNLFRALLENEDFRTRFITRYAEILNGPFRTEQTLKTFDQIKANYAPEVAEHIARWHYPRSYEGWNADVEALARFVRQRPCMVEGHIMDFFYLSEFGFSCIGDSDDQTELVLAPNPNRGKFTLYNSTDRDWSNLHVTVYNVHANVILRQFVATMPAKGRIRVDLGAAAAGVYIVEIRSDNFVKRRKFVVDE